MLKKLQSKKGFTLMEMLIVVAIIAVLVAIAIPVFNGALTKSKEAADVANVRATYAEWQTAMLTENTKAPADKDAFLKDIFFRESQGCTGIGNGIAIPHGKSPSVTKVGIAIAKLTNEIEWETLDGKGVKVILLFAVGDKTEDAQEHLKLLAQVAGKLGNDEIVEKLLKAESVEEIKSVFL